MLNSFIIIMIYKNSHVLINEFKFSIINNSII